VSQSTQFALFAPTPKISFGKHNGCAPSRYWLLRGVRTIARDSLLFSREGHFLELGVSQSMAQALKFWCLAFKLIEPQDQAQTYFTTTPFAQQLLGETGSDPYLEDAVSLWILQWTLLNHPIYFVYGSGFSCMPSAFIKVN
jgi:Protein of unknown function (DUF4007)